MNDEPTDIEQAREHLDRAWENYEDTPGDQACIERALLAIAHTLLAIHDHLTPGQET